MYVFRFIHVLQSGHRIFMKSKLTTIKQTTGNSKKKKKVIKTICQSKLHLQLTVLPL